MKKINLLDIFGLIDNQMINRAIETDSAEKLKELKLLEKRKRFSGLFIYISIFAGGIAVFVIGITIFNNNFNKDNILLSNPMIEVKDINELEKYIKMDLSKYEIKDIKQMYRFEDDSLIQITYLDDSTMRISEGQIDNSGINGATLKEEKEINNIKVSIYQFENTNYAIWKNGKYSFSYVASDNENIDSILSKIV